MKSSTIFFPTILLFLFLGISDLKESDSEFEKLSEQFINEYFSHFPEEAAGLGLHQYDGKVSEYSGESVKAYINRLKEYKNMFGAIDPLSLKPNNYLDYKILTNKLNKELFYLEDREGYYKSPMLYAGAIDVSLYIKRDFAPLEDRVRSIIAIEKQAPTILSHARKNLREVLPLTVVKTAINIAKGSADFLGKDLVTALKDLKNESLRKEFETVNSLAIKELNDYAGWLESERLPKADNSFPLGRHNYLKMLSGEMVSFSPEEILEIGLKQLKKEQQMFEETARKIDPDKNAIDVNKEIQKDHPTAENLIPDTKKNLEAIREFIIKKNIISVPSEVRAIVEETPQYARATSFASMDTPGPFEKSTQAYYYVTPVEDSWSEKQKEEWLTAFNYYTTDIVSIHEAYPGHYFQFLHLNNSPASRIRKIFGSYAFSEGWAHYTEQMMIDEGFGADKDQVTAAKYRLAQLSESLLRYCRLCVSIMMHTQGMTVEEATKFFMDNCYYEETPARSEANRGTYDPGYLNYSLGKLMILKLREDYKLQEGNNYSLQKFHDEMLSYGSPPIPLLREMMLRDKSKWGDVL